MERRISIRNNDVKLIAPVSKDGLNCGYLGPRGTYTEQAAGDLLQDQAALVAMPTITQVIKALVSKEIDLGFVPIENSMEGGVTESIRGLIHSGMPDDCNIRILAEQILPIRHMLFGTEEAIKKEILHSHPQAIGQCTSWINNNLPNATVVRENSTAEAVRIAVEKNELAIGNRLAGELYKASILSDDIMDLKTNHTRFWLLGQGETYPTEDDRTVFVFTLKNEPGALMNVIHPFASRNVSINKIDTLPLGTLDEYYFMMAVDGHENDPKLQEAITDLEKRVWKTKTLGSFQKMKSQISYDPNATSNGWVDLATL